MTLARLLTADLTAQLLANGHASLKANEAGDDFDPYPVLLLFAPGTDCVWLLTELDPDAPMRAFGLCDLGLGCPELGWVDLRELLDVRGLLNIPVERDVHFVADRRLSDYATLAHLRGRIVT